MPVVTIENLGPAGEALPFTFGQVFAPGHLKNGDLFPSGVLPDGAVVPLQFDTKAKHPDGSVRHAILSGVLPKAAAGEKVRMALMPTTARPVGWDKARDLAKPNVAVSVTVDGVAYTATHTSAAGPEWLTGPVVAERWAVQPLTGPTGAHPHLSVRFAVRTYDAGSRVEVVLENDKAFAGPARNYTYDIEIKVGGTVEYAEQGVTIYHHARWRWVNWGQDQPPLAVVHPDTAYLIASRAIPNYDLSVKPSEKLLLAWATKSDASLAAHAGAHKIGPINEYMPNTGGRPDIGPLPGFAVAYLLSHDMRPREAMLYAADGSGTWPIHYRDGSTGYAVRTDSPATAQLTTHGNMAHKGPLPVPRTVDGQAKTPLTPDTAHQPSLVYLPYLITGERFYLDELHFWAAWNPLETAPDNHAGLGLVRWQQLRGQAWSLRTLGHAAYITPDIHPLKAYFTAQLAANIDWYTATYVKGNPNKLGIYDGSGEGAFQLGGTPAGTGVAPWQDDYFTWAIGHLVELGFSAAEPLLKWKAQFVVGRLTAPGFDPIMAADYFYKVRDAAGAPVYGSFAELYQKNYSGDVIADDDRKPMSVAGKKWIDQKTPAEQSEWIRAAGRKWTEGQTFGYAGSNMGYPSNMQPALATAVSLGAPGADNAWQVFESRTVKPNYADGPQFAIVPRAKAVVVAPPVTPPVTPPAAIPVTPPATPSARVRLEQAIQRYSSVPDAELKVAMGAAAEALQDVLVAERAARGGK
jgi:hypothetical protein